MWGSILVDCALLNSKEVWRNPIIFLRCENKKDILFRVKTWRARAQFKCLVSKINNYKLATLCELYEIKLCTRFFNYYSNNFSVLWTLEKKLYITSMFTTNTSMNSELRLTGTRLIRVIYPNALNPLNETVWFSLCVLIDKANDTCWVLVLASNRSKTLFNVNNRSRPCFNNE